MRVLLAAISLVFFTLELSAQPSRSVQPDGTTEYVTLYPNGQKKAVYYYDSANVRVGTWMFYTNDGLLEQKIDHGLHGSYRKYIGGEQFIAAAIEAMSLSGEAWFKWSYGETPLLLTAGFRNGSEEDKWQLTSKDTLDMQFAGGRPSGVWKLHNKRVLLKIDASKTNPTCVVYDQSGKPLYAGALNKKMRASGDWQVFDARGKFKFFSSEDALRSSQQWDSYTLYMDQIESIVADLPYVFTRFHFFGKKTSK